MKLILCDLNMTLSANMKEVMDTFFGAKKPFGDVVKDVEVYREDLVGRLTEAQQSGWWVDLFTVRKVRWKDDTLQNLTGRTGFVPDGAWFNDTGMSGKQAATVKRRLLERAVNVRQPELLFALESNSAVHRMFETCGVPYRRFNGLDTIPRVKDLADFAQPPPGFR